MPSDGQTGVVIPVPAADALLASVATQFPGVVREGVPAHLSVQYPFLAADELDQRVTETLSELFAPQRPIRVTFAECGRRGGFVYVRPDSTEELTQLSGALRQRWPQVLRCADSDDDVGPHVTIAMHASEDVARTVEQQVIAALPISAELGEAWLVAFEGRWVLRHRYQFGAGR